MNKIPVGILGATGMVGQRFVQLLQDHPQFETVSLSASERNVGKPYAEACRWVLDEDMPANVRDLVITPIQPSGPAKIIFSALPSEIASEEEPRYAEAGYYVCSNASAYRMAADVPLIIPEVNGDHISLLEVQRKQRGWPGCIVTSPNCTTTTIVMALKPLDQTFGVNRLSITTMQAVSGNGYPGLSYLDIDDNIIPYIAGEEEKIVEETCSLLGTLEDGTRKPKDIPVSVQVNRVPVVDGHMVSLSIGFEHKPSVAEAIEVLSSYRGPDVVRGLPSAPSHPVIVRSEVDRPQPRRDRGAAGGMAATVGRVRECPLLDLRLVAVTHNAIRGAAGGAVLNAELLLAGGILT